MILKSFAREHVATFK